MIIFFPGSSLSTKFVPVTTVQSEYSKQWYCDFHQNVRKFHTATLLYNEVNTVKCPPFAESITEGDIRWEKAIGDSVQVDEVIAEVETDKTSIQIPSPVAGIIESLLVNDGDTVEAGMQLCTIKAGAAGEAKRTTSQPSEAKETPPAPKETPPATPPPDAAASGPIPTTPPPAQPLPTGPVSSTPTSEVKPKAAAPQMPAGGVSTSGGRGESRVKMNRMRQRIAQRLKDAQNTCAMLTTFNEVDMSNIMELRTKYKDAFLKTHGLKLGFMSAFIKASAYALQDLPQVNAVIDDTDIVYRDYIDISVAVSTPKGLVVPVIRNVEGMNYAEIEQAMNALGEKARSGNLAIEDMDGGTFTISNGGVFGSMFGTPIINPPQSAILGMHAIFDRPVSVKGKVEIRPMMYIALTYDHRLIDGREAVTFLKKIKSAVEDPASMLLQL
ncbi:dihydrolipoyllysine-residue succinyltransferase component of 2-oxoglutarate dehydrogenase complex, mitochondrial-like [Mercenaria mercenaria]|uniref:dihydrolipoyllysine-residue succinyltransferase component of 2-oxoglutarate dehydrogenase complex, mitochondrial-like n=1 Tax=Mercenaria mercenaria TaxID=6596 RepID=UPI00234E99E5|nr:dihydrolipoyllysine-residue succinyltransferase component of 2-oxoglutarate dehydrogenase complex, mitochondrial-like [Mercenaria mercenaria]